ncbi:hypothetical protein GLE_0695 [Lysobacter enzymogenes]|uniref:Uncharacterized protein n=1 Tax=Lysobacter enzymogenes TaxID=69 RepID=A0A0S2DBZ8_LYSEN|nr:hypothetical protein GLE_0695 [Lysobacter enzymogenes]
MNRRAAVASRAPSLRVRPADARARRRCGESRHPPDFRR